MITALIILLYVGNVFLNRHLNKIIYQRDKFIPKLWGFWFVPIATTIALLVIFIEQSSSKGNWFTGKNW